MITINKLKATLIKQEISTTEQQINQLSAYLELLAKWNKSYNLTAIDNIDKMIPYHILDSLTLLPFLNGKTVLDVGTGAGLPGIPLAIIRPEMQFYLLDSNGKKTRFLQQVKHELNLNNIHIVNERIENYQPNIEFDIICSRAFASLKDFIALTKKLANKNTCLLAMKGALADQEIDELNDSNFKIIQHEVEIYGVGGKRFIVILSLKI